MRFTLAVFSQVTLRAPVDFCTGAASSGRRVLQRGLLRCKFPILESLPLRLQPQSLTSKWNHAASLEVKEHQNPPWLAMSTGSGC